MQFVMVNTLLISQIIPNVPFDQNMLATTKRSDLEKFLCCKKTPYVECIRFQNDGFIEWNI